jgi:hypothetical protein
MISMSLLVAFCTSVGYLSAQENTSVLDAPPEWKSEIIPFPIGFAQDIPLKGIEELRFAPNWNNPESDEFWTYMFVWYVEPDKPMTVKNLTTYFQSYYDGLMGIEVRNSETASTEKLNYSEIKFKKSKNGFVGEMKVWDSFFTKDYIVLNMKVTEQLCNDNSVQIVRCEVSPKPFKHNIWSAFNEVVLKDECK